MKVPGRSPARVRKGAGEAAAVESGTAGAQPKHARAVSRENAGKRRAEAPSPAPQTGMQLHTVDGIRKYLTAGERDAFLREADLAERPVRTLCMTLAYTGCRLSEALALTADRVDRAAGVLVFESLKKRRTGIFRSVPVPPALLDTLDMVHGIRELHARRGKGRGVRLWPHRYNTEGLAGLCNRAHAGVRSAN
jgi:integrase/recombinase XerD